MPNWCVTNHVIEGDKKELDALYETMKKLQEMEQPLVENGFGPKWLGCLVKALGKNPEEVECRGYWTELERTDDTLRMEFETAWTPCYEVTALMKAVYPSIRIFYKAEEPNCEVYLKNDADGKYFPETECDGVPYDLMTEEDELRQSGFIRGLHDGSIKIVASKPSE